MINEHDQELASLYALDLLGADERARFERAMASNPALAELVAEIRTTAAGLAHLPAAPAPSAALKERILSGVGQKPPAPAVAPASGPAGAPNRSWRLPWALAAGFALTTVWFGARYYAARAQAEQLAQQMALADVALQSARVQADTERTVSARLAADYANFKAAADRDRNLSRLKISALTSMLKDSPHAIAVAVWDPQHDDGVFTVDNLPPNQADQRYELWLIDSKPVSAGVFTVGADGRTKIVFRPTAQVRDVKKFAVSREKNDGLRSHAAPGQVIMLSE